MNPPRVCPVLFQRLQRTGSSRLQGRWRCSAAKLKHLPPRCRPKRQAHRGQHNRKSGASGREAEMRAPSSSQLQNFLPVFAFFPTEGPGETVMSCQEVKSCCCSCRGLEFNSQHPHLGPYSCNSKGSKALFKPPEISSDVHRYAHTHK